LGNSRKGQHQQAGEQTKFGAVSSGTKNAGWINVFICSQYRHEYLELGTSSNYYSIQFKETIERLIIQRKTIGL